MNILKLFARSSIVTLRAKPIWPNRTDHQCTYSISLCVCINAFGMCTNLNPTTATTTTTASATTTHADAVHKSRRTGRAPVSMCVPCCVRVCVMVCTFYSLCYTHPMCRTTTTSTIVSKCAQYIQHIHTASERQPASLLDDCSRMSSACICIP